MLTAIVLLATVSHSGSQRVSIVERLKALDKGIRQGLQRQKTELPIFTPISPQDDLPLKSVIYDQEQQETATHSQQTAVNTLIPVLGPKPAEQINQKAELQQLGVSPEDADGTSDLVRQLTESFEEEDEVKIYPKLFKINSATMFCFKLKGRFERQILFQRKSELNQITFFSHQNMAVLGQQLKCINPSFPHRNLKCKVGYG